MSREMGRKEESFCFVILLIVKDEIEKRVYVLCQVLREFFKEIK